MTTNDASRPAHFRPSLTGLAAFALGGAIATGLAGPFGMAVTQPNALARVAHFVLVAVFMTALTIGLAELLDRARPQLGLWALVIGAALAALPGVLVVRTSLHIFSPASLVQVTNLTLLIETLAMNVILALLGWRVLGGTFQARRIAELEKSVGPGLSQKLPPELRSAPILALQAEDHYLRVHTARGETLIHMRIGDAEQLLAGEDGVRPHRSFWVARRAFQGVERKDGKLRLKLASGQLIPVSWLANAPSGASV